jgi:hypothetical protein
MATTASQSDQSRLTTFRLVYRSHSLLPPDGRSAALASIFQTARSRNKQVGVTGALLLTDHYFVQALEGEESVVRALYARIAEDPRHEQVTLIEDRAVGVRVFSRWAMAEVSKSGGADIPLIADADHGGVTPAAARDTTREQSEVLRVMRNSIGADTL